MSSRPPVLRAACRENKRKAEKKKALKAAVEAARKNGGKSNNLKVCAVQLYLLWLLLLSALLLVLISCCQCARTQLTGVPTAVLAAVCPGKPIFCQRHENAWKRWELGLMEKV